MSDFVSNNLLITVKILNKSLNFEYFTYQIQKVRLQVDFKKQFTCASFVLFFDDHYTFHYHHKVRRHLITFT